MLGEEEDLEGQPVNPRTLDQEWSVTVQEERICYVFWCIILYTVVGHLIRLTSCAEENSIQQFFKKL